MKSLFLFFWRFLVGLVVVSRTGRIARTLSSFVRANDAILDVGAGGGWIAKKLQDQTKARLTLLDVIDFNQTSLPLRLYDGKTIPFQDQTFDLCTLLFMLHHCADPLRVLKEAVRVSRDRIIIMEDTFESPLERAFVCAHDIGANLPTFLLSGFKNRMNLPLNFKSVEEWKKVFGSLGLQVIHIEQQRSFPLPIQRTMFVLKR